MKVTKAQTFVDVSAELDSVCNWLGGIGIGFSKTRVREYKAIFSTLADAQRANDLQRYSQKYAPMDFVNAIVERSELMRIYQGLSGLNSDGLKERLKKALRGHSLVVMDKNERSGRDFTLELDVAAKFARNGYEIDFGSDADVKAVKDGLCVFVECKRLKKEASVRDNIKKGLKQLRNRYKTAGHTEKKCYGILALSIGQLINPELGFLVGRDTTDIASQCRRHADSFEPLYSRYWRHSGVDARSLGVAILMDAPGTTTENNLPFSLHEVIISNIVDRSAPEYALFKQIMQVFEPEQ